MMEEIAVDLMSIQIGAQNVNALKVYYGTFNVFVLSIIGRKHSIMGDQHYVWKDFF